MRVRWLGWAGLELEADGARLVIDPLADAAAVWGPFGEAARTVPLPPVVPARAKGDAVGALVTHLHRDHADAAALTAALAPGAPLLGPEPSGEDGVDELGLAQAATELAAAGLTLTPMAPWATRELGPFRVTALPAVDGSGDPQVSWAVEAGGTRVLHLGDTMLHGFWWRIARRLGPADVVVAPVNGARLAFPHHRPSTGLPGAMDPEEAAAAAAALGARLAVPMHFGGYRFPPVYVPEEDAAARFLTAAADRGLTARELAPGEELEL